MTRPPPVASAAEPWPATPPPGPDTIFAQASGAGRAAIAVIRMSGPCSRPVLERLVGTRVEPRVATVVPLRHAGEILDRALILWFPAPASFTGEDVVEFQTHGGRAVVAALLGALAAQPECRLAQPGEFTQRAFLNGKMDLGAVEGLADLIDAQTEAQRRQAQRHIDGALNRWVERLRADLLSALALAEGAIDFADEDDLIGAQEAQIGRLVAGVVDLIEAELAAEVRGAKLRDGLMVAIAGPPNVGKSTLLNALAGRDVAIVSPLAGTTRDTIELALDLDGWPVVLVDTAGLRDTDDPVEGEGVRRARQRAASADLVLWLRDGGTSAMPALDTAGAVWTVATKADIEAPAEGARFCVSARTGQGLEALTAALARFAEETMVGGEGAIVTRVRHRTALEQARSCLAPHTGAATRHQELVADDLRRAIAALSGLVARIATEDVLGEIFSRFCIGK